MLLLALLFQWQAKVHFSHDPPRKSGGSDGAIHVRGASVRIEEPTPMGDAVILSINGRVQLLFPQKKQVLEVAPRQAALATVPPLSLEGMSRVGEETIDGQRCTIWEETLETKEGRVHNRLWVPQQPLQKKNNFFFLRYVTQTQRGATRADLTEIRAAPQPDALFRVPRGFTKK